MSEPAYTPQQYAAALRHALWRAETDAEIHEDMRAVTPDEHVGPDLARAAVGRLVAEFLRTKLEPPNG